MTELTTATEMTYTDDAIVAGRDDGATGVKKALLSGLATYFFGKLFPSLTGNDGKYLKVNATEDGVEWDTPAGGAALEVLDEGVSEDAAVVSLDFVGAGVTATQTAAGAIEINIPGGGAASIDDLSDVDTTTVAPADGDTLIWNDTLGQWEPGAPSGGGGSGLPELLDYAYATAATAATAMGSGTLVAGMSLSFTLSGTRDIHVIFAALLSRSSGQARMQVKVNGTSYNPATHTQPFYSVETEGGGRYTNGSYILSLGAGTHTIELWAEDAQTVVNTTWYERYIKAEALS